MFQYFENKYFIRGTFDTFAIAICHNVQVCQHFYFTHSIFIINFQQQTWQFLQANLGVDGVIFKKQKSVA